MITSVWFMVVLGIVIANLLLSGIIGLMRRKIHYKNMYMNIMTFPLSVFGFVGSALGTVVYHKSHKEAVALASSTAALISAVILTLGFGLYYLSEFKLIAPHIITAFVRYFVLTFAAVLVGFLIYFAEKRSHRK